MTFPPLSGRLLSSGSLRSAHPSHAWRRGPLPFTWPWAATGFGGDSLPLLRRPVDALESLQQVPGIAVTTICRELIKLINR